MEVKAKVSECPQRNHLALIREVISGNKTHRRRSYTQLFKTARVCVQ